MGLAQYADDGFFAPSKIAHRCAPRRGGRPHGGARPDASAAHGTGTVDRTHRRLREMVEVINNA